MTTVRARSTVAVSAASLERGEMRSRRQCASFSLLGSLLERLRRVAAQNGIDLPALLLASFQLCVQRHRGPDSMNIAVMRSLARTSRQIGDASSVMMLHVSSPTADDVLFTTLAQATNRSLNNGHTPADRLSAPREQGNAGDGGNDGNDGSRIAGGFLWRQSDAQTLRESQEAWCDALDAIPGRQAPGVLLDVTESGERLVASMTLSRELMPVVSAADLADSYRTLLESVAEHPEWPVSQLNMVSASQRRRVLEDWNDTHVELPRSQQVEEWFDAQASRSPEAVAIRGQGVSVSYRELLIRSNQLANYLRELAIGPDDLVAICTDRSPDMVIAMLGVLKSGAAYVPLDPSYPSERLAFMLEDAAVAAIVTQQQWVGQLPASSAPIIRLDADRRLLAGRPTALVASKTGPDNLAYVIYTSGSTGKPKGVAVRRGALANFLNAMKRTFQFGPSDRLLAVTTISFDIAELEVYLPLLAGGSVVLATRKDAADASRLARLLEEEDITFMQCTPATWRMLLDSAWVGKPDLAMLCGGEAMTRDLADGLLQRGACLWNMYGPTETTIWSTMCRIETGGEPISVGRPIDNTQVYILDPQLRLVPVGAVGELYIGGMGLARGYLNRPELTAEKFIRDPFRGEPGARIYKTGDLARYWPDGRIECLGRVDHQVKIRGFRIELPEIEARLAAHPSIRQCAVVARDDTRGDKYLAAYWSVRGQATQAVPSGDDLRRFLGQSLPAYMVPSVFVQMDALPLTPNGKIDRRGLPPPERQGRPRDSGYLAPRTETERRLVRIWEELLDVRPIGVRDDFFAIGGHSLAAARMVAQMELQFGTTVPLVTLLSAPSIESLAMVLDGQGPQRSGVLVSFQPPGVTPSLFLVAGVGGHVLIFRELARLLGEHCPMSALQGIGLDGREDPLSRMEDIADRYIREIMAAQPQGPYFVGGWSMGGVIAFEIARQMTSRGLPVGRLLIIDAYPPWVVGRLERLRLHWASLRRRSWRGRLSYFGQRLTHRVEAARRRMGIDTVEEVDGAMAELIQRSSLAQFAALRTYRPQPFPGDLVLLRADQTIDIRDPRSSDPQMGWGTLVHGRIAVLPIPGSHTGIFVGENVKSLAETIRQGLALSPSMRR